MQNTTQEILQSFVDQNGSDLYLTVGAPPCMRLHNNLEYYPNEALKEENLRAILKDIVSEKAIAEFDAALEYNTALNWQGKRLRVNIFRQKQHTGIAIRRVASDIPTFKSLNLPDAYGDLIMEKRGLILLVGPTGAGKSSSLAAMIGHRNQHGSGHIVTIEDPIEFEHHHKNCIITQRDVGIDTLSYSTGLQNALRQMPDVIVIGEIRDLDTMENAIAFAETGHLCIATLHANNTNQAIERILNFFPEEKHAQVLMNLGLNLRAILSQRLVKNTQNTQSLAIEIMFNIGHIKELILEGKVREIREQIEKGKSSGMQTFEQALLELYENEIITEETAMAEADSPANLRLAIRQSSIGKYRSSDMPSKPIELVDKKQF